AGAGKRLLPLTKKIPKCLIKVLGKPIIQWQVDILDKLGITNIHIVTGYKGEMVKDYFINHPQREVTYIHQEEQTGTADAIYLAKSFVDGDFIVLAGDTIFQENDLKRLIGKKNSLLYTKQTERLYEYGTIEFDGEKIVKIWEKSTIPVSELVNCSAYHFDKRIFDYIPKTSIDERFGERIITNTINLMLEKKIRFYGIYTDDLYEITYPKDIQEVERKLNEK
ncbi:MAG: NTP transferase domain-containing protein, partial [Actinobacteria bacterium]|nr:NTP transferase domain-containing protein [Actinomycetota bacterium]MBE3114668.1 NTP transferase domain-containing protein [Actinomycetota bacterium]